MLVLTRVSAVIMTAPVTGAYSVPYKIKALLIIAVSALITPLVSHHQVPIPANMAGLVPLALDELVIGLCLGLGAQMLFVAAQVTGQMAGQMSGMQLSGVLNPSSGSSIPLFAQLLDLTSTATFVLIGGPAMILSGLLKTFHQMPPGHVTMPSDFIHHLVTLLSFGFEMGIKMGAPVVLSLLISILLLGLIGRVLPQLNVLQVGFNVNSIVMIGGIALSINAGILMLANGVDSQIQSIVQWLIESADFHHQPAPDSLRPVQT